MKVSNQELRQIIREELEGELTTQIAPETGEWDKRDDLQTFFDLLENAVNMSAQWRTVEEAQQVIQDLGKKADRIRDECTFRVTCKEADRIRSGGGDIF